MVHPGFSTFDRKQQWWLVLVAMLPLLVVAVAKQLGVISLLKLGIVGLVGAAFLAVIFVRPMAGIYFMAFYVYSGITMYLPGVVAMAVMAVMLLAAALELFRGEPDRVTDWMFWLFVALFAMFAIQSMMVAHYPAYSIAKFFKFLKVIALTFLVAHYVRTPDQLRRLALVIVAGAVATVALGLINLKLGLTEQVAFAGNLEVYRFSGAHTNPNRAAAIMCSTIPLGVFAVKYATSRIQRGVAVVGIIVITVGVFSTFSRSAIFPFSIVTAIVLIREIRSHRGFFVIVAITALAVLLTPGYYWERLSILWRVVSSNVGQDFSVTIRLEALKTAWRLFTENPWTGIGLHNFVFRGATDVVQRIVVHNVYMEIAVGTGIFGLLAFLGVFGSGFRHALAGSRRAWPQRADGSGRYMGSLSFYFGLAMFSIMISALFGTIPFVYPYWLPLAGMLVVGNLIRSNR